MSTEPTSPQQPFLRVAETPPLRARDFRESPGRFAEQLDSAARPPEPREDRVEAPERDPPPEDPSRDAEVDEAGTAREPDSEVAPPSEAETETAPPEAEEPAPEDDGATAVTTVPTQLTQTVEPIPQTDASLEGEALLTRPAEQTAATEQVPAGPATGQTPPPATPGDLDGAALGTEAGADALTPTSDPPATDASAETTGDATPVITTGGANEPTGEATGDETGRAAPSEAGEGSEGFEGFETPEGDAGTDQERQQQPRPDAGPTPIEQARESRPDPTAAADDSAVEEASAPTNPRASSTTGVTPSEGVDTPSAPTPTSGPAEGVVERTEQARPVEQASAPPRVDRPTVDPARFLTRVARAIDFANDRGGGPIELRLSPPELGSLQVKIELREGVLTASLEAETPAARQTLLDNLPALRDRLEQQQIRIDKFDVDVRDDSGQRGGDYQPRDNSGGRSDRQANPQGPSGPRNPTAETRPDLPEPSVPRTIDFGDDTINLVA